jgi:hypothetical protein
MILSFESLRATMATAEITGKKWLGGVDWTEMAVEYVKSRETGTTLTCVWLVLRFKGVPENLSFGWQWLPTLSTIK